MNAHLDKKLRPSSTEVGLFNETSDAGIHVRDDGCVEIFAGKTNILVDGTSGIITLNGQKINSVAKSIGNSTDASGFRINSGILNPKWLPSSIETAMASISVDSPELNPLCLARSPLVVLSQLSLDTPIVVGAPASPAQSIMPLRSLVKPVPMFKTNRAALTIMKKLEKIIKMFAGI